VTNISNIEILQKQLGYYFKDKTLLNQALTHKSKHYHNNERLEFLGDAILNLIMAEILYLQFEKASEGELTRARASLVKEQTLSEIANKLNLSEYLILGLGELKSGGFRRDSILADALEAIIAAIYLDAKDLETCKTSVYSWFSDKITHLKPHAQEKDPKSRLQEWLQAQQKPLPKYEVTALEGEPHCQNFTVSCSIEGVSEMGIGIGASRRIAEQIAAQQLWEKIHD